ncbi:hypothetical protein KKH27_08745 [bacterium]|nr:hypothetical protein [bacterium]MBU1983893.1 hypothetical protein [bacterium]
MRIESYGTHVFPRIPAAGPQGTASADPASGSDQLSPQERLRLLLEEKRSLTQTAFEPTAGEPTLGKYIDLRV